MACGGQRPTVEPAFQVPQGSPPSHLELHSLPSLTRFLYGGGQFAFHSPECRRGSPRSGEGRPGIRRTARRATTLTRALALPAGCKPGSRLNRHSSCAMPCLALTAAQHKRHADCTIRSARTPCTKFIQTCSSANAKHAWPCCAKMSHCMPCLGTHKTPKLCASRYRSCVNQMPAICADYAHSAAVSYLSNQPSKHALLRHMDRDRLQDVLIDARLRP